MSEIKFRVWHSRDRKMYFRGYQKWFHVLLCDADPQEKDGGKGIPVKRASYSDCVFLTGTGILDRSGKEIYEGDKLKIIHQAQSFTGIVKEVPDMYKSRRLHPLESVLKPLGLSEKSGELEFDILGNEFETT